MHAINEHTAEIIDLAAERARRRPQPQRIDVAKLPVAPHCPVCGDVPGVECCEFGRSN